MVTNLDNTGFQKRIQIFFCHFSILVIINKRHKRVGCVHRLYFTGSQRGSGINQLLAPKAIPALTV